MKRPLQKISVIKREEVFNYLKKCASDKHTPSYKEVGEAVGLWYRVVRFPLYFIWSKCNELKLPELNAITVNGKTKRPGAGCPKLQSSWENVRDKVFAFNWGSISYHDLINH